MSLSQPSLDLFTEQEEGEFVARPKLPRQPSSWEIYKSKRSLQDEDGSTKRRPSGGVSSVGKSSQLMKAMKYKEGLKSSGAKHVAVKAVLDQAHNMAAAGDKKLPLKDDMEYEQAVLLHDFFGDPSPRVGFGYGELVVNKGEYCYIIDDEHQAKFWWLCKTPGRNCKVGLVAHPFSR